MLKIVINLLILLLLNCSIGWCQQNRDDVPLQGILNKSDTAIAVIPIKYIRVANIKLLERTHLININVQKDSIIKLKDLYIDNQNVIIKDFQHRLLMSNDIAKQFSKENAKITRRKNIWKCVSIGAIVGVGGYIIFK